jgi:hypothetical protein
MRSPVAQRPPDLAIVSEPILGESVFSYLRRLSMLNGHRQFDTFSIAIGVGILRRGSSDKVWTRLAAATGISLSDLAPMRWLRSEKPQFRQHTFLGDFISFGFALPKSNRYCVECLRENLIFREFWAATYVIACPIHGIELTEACTCGRQHDNRKNGQPWHCICGKSFLEAPVVKAIPSAILAAQNMSHCAGLPIAIGANTAPYSKQLPTAFRDFNAHDYSAYLHTLGGAASLEASEDRFRNRRKYGSTQVLGEDFSLVTVGKRIEAACEILETWPRGLGPLIDRLAFRGQEEAEKHFSQAFSTRAGSMLRNPMRGSDGLPLRELRLELDAYWNNKYPRHKRRRNLSVVNVLALRTTKLFNARQLAFALGASHWKKAHSRVLARVVSEIADDEAKLNDEELAALIRTRSLALYKDSQRSVSAGDARRLLEGAPENRVLQAWEHPDLLPADPRLFGLKLRGARAYSPESIEAAKQRLAAIAQPREDISGLGRLVTDGLRRGGLRPWYTKTDALLDMFAGKFAVYTQVEHPTLQDLFVDVKALGILSAAHSPVLMDEGTGFAELARMNDLIRLELGEEHVLALSQFRRMTRCKVVRTRTRDGYVRGKVRKTATRLYSITDVMSLMKKFQSGKLTYDETIPFIVPYDISQIVSEMWNSGHKDYFITGALTRMGIRTVNGSRWNRCTLKDALRQFPNGVGIFGIDLPAGASPFL